MHARHFLVALATLTLVAPRPASAARLKELVEIEGFRGNALVGLGLVVGLNGTGDGSSYFMTRRPLAELLKHLGNLQDPLSDVFAKNVALVTVTATLPAFARPGVSIDVTVSSIGTAKSLQGGTLISTPLRGADGEVYALAQGSLVVGGFSAQGGSGSSAVKNHPTVAHVPSGATIEREGPSPMATEQIVLLLREPDFTTATRIAAAIDKVLGEGVAQVKSPSSVVVPVPKDKADKVVGMVAQLEAIEAIPDARGRVIIDERTGTVVVGNNVTLGPAAIASGGLQVTVAEHKEVSQPLPFSKGQTTVTPTSEVTVDEKNGAVHLVPESATVGDVASALNTLGVKPRDLVSIFQALKAAGALRAELQVL